MAVRWRSLRERSHPPRTRNIAERAVARIMPISDIVLNPGFGDEAPEVEEEDEDAEEMEEIESMEGVVVVGVTENMLIAEVTNMKDVLVPEGVSNSTDMLLARDALGMEAMFGVEATAVTS